MYRLILRNTAIFVSLIGILFALAGCEKQAGQRASSLTEVRYTEVRGERLVLTSELPGRVSALMVSEVRPQVTGIIQERLFEEGMDVTAGQVLYRIDPALFQAGLNNARAGLAKAEANEVSARLLAGRYGKIIKTNAVSRQEYDDALAAHKQARADVEAARQALETASINLGYSEIKAPVGGRIGRSFVTPGALVTQNQAAALATIQHLDTVYVDLSQSNTELIRLRRAFAANAMESSGADSARVKLKLEDGSPYARFTAASFEEEEPDWIEGDLLFSDVTIEKSTGVVNIRARFENPSKVLLPGMYVRAVVEEGVLQNAVLVPQKTVMRDTRGRAMVYVLKESQDAAHTDGFTVEQRYVELNRNVGNQWLIGSGLEPGEKLLVDGHLKVRPGHLVAGVPLDSGEFLSAGRKSGTTTR